jgi:predicted protein tyrosine phosphatase
MDFFWIDAYTKGRLAVCRRPLGGEDLEGDLRHGRVQGLDVLVSMLTPEDEFELGLSEEGALARKLGMRFLSVPVPDFSVPDSVESIAPQLLESAAAVADGRALAVHCRMGIGRSPLFAASVLVVGGIDPEDAWRRIAVARGLRVPDTQAQRAWLMNVVAWMRASGRGP